MPTRTLIEQIIFKHFRVNTSPKKAREETDEVMAMFDRDFVERKKETMNEFLARRH